MSQQNDLGPISLPNSSAIGQYLRVIVSGAAIALASANQRGHGVNQKQTQTTSASAQVRTYNSPGTLKMVANGAITKYADVYGADNGKISGSGAVKLGVALETAASDGDVIEVLPTHPNRVTPLFVAVADGAAVTNTTTETLFGNQYSIPANMLKAGDRLKIKYQVIATLTNSTDTLAIKLYIGGLTGTVLVSHAATDVANNDTVIGEIELTIRTAGASGTFVAIGTYKQIPAQPGTITVKDAIVGSTAIDTTAAQVVGLSGTWSAANAGDSAVCRVLNVDHIAA